MRTIPNTLEILETRISPAVFFVSPISNTVTDSAGANAMDTLIEQTAATKTGFEFAISLATGDKLVFDTNANRKMDAGDIVLASVKTGQAMAFMHETTAPNDGRFSP